MAESEIIFEGEMPFPEHNVLLYRGIYRVEQWLRRMAYAAMLARHGGHWRGVVPVEMMTVLKTRLKSLPGRIHLDCENSDNAIWLTTLEELRVLLTQESTWPVVRKLTGYHRERLQNKIDELREIRNVIGHNRAVSTRTLRIWHGIAESLEFGIEHFKTQVPYNLGQTPDESDEVQQYFERRTLGIDWHVFQPMFSISEHFYLATHLPVPPWDRSIRAAGMLDYLANQSGVILGVMLNKEATTEFTITWPRVLPFDLHCELIDLFVDIGPSVWTPTEYERQSAKFVCHPLLWFYENQRPLPE
jgi:hypothetical protein